jgi:hypothetical protein
MGLQKGRQMGGTAVANQKAPGPFVRISTVATVATLVAGHGFPC